MPRSRLDRGITVAELFVLTGLVGSKSEARRLIAGNGARVNGRGIGDEAAAVNAGDLKTGALKLSAGRKRHALVRTSTLELRQPSGDGRCTQGRCFQRRLDRHAARPTSAELRLDDQPLPAGSRPSGVYLSIASGRPLAKRANKFLAAQPRSLDQGIEHVGSDCLLELGGLDGLVGPALHPRSGCFAPAVLAKALQQFRQATRQASRRRSSRHCSPCHETSRRCRPTRPVQLAVPCAPWAAGPLGAPGLAAAEPIEKLCDLVAISETGDRQQAKQSGH